MLAVGNMADVKPLRMVDHAHSTQHGVLVIEVRLEVRRQRTQVWIVRVRIGVELASHIRLLMHARICRICQISRVQAIGCRVMRRKDNIIEVLCLELCRTPPMHVFCTLRHFKRSALNFKSLTTVFHSRRLVARPDRVSRLFAVLTI